MSGSRKNLFAALVALALAPGCCTVNLTETTYPQDRIPLDGGPGARQGELVRIVRLEKTRYTGEKVSFGLFPGIPAMANDFGGTGGYVPATTLEIVVGPFVNAFSLVMPTLGTLFVEPFTMTSDARGMSWDVFAMGFVGAYRWRVMSHDEVEVEHAEDVLVNGGYRPDTARIKVSKSEDGTKMWHAYPGFQALVCDVERDGKVDVAHGRWVRRFRKSKRNPGCLSFEDRASGK